jgi:hypothetical protein
MPREHTQKDAGRAVHQWQVEKVALAKLGVHALRERALECDYEQPRRGVHPDHQRAPSLKKRLSEIAPQRDARPTPSPTDGASLRPAQIQKGARSLLSQTGIAVAREGLACFDVLTAETSNRLEET